MSLYADDILLFVQNPKTSLTDIMKLTNEYSIISDYSINWTKSTILPLNMEPHDRSIQNMSHQDESYIPTLSFQGLNQNHGSSEHK